MSAWPLARRPGRVSSERAGDQPSCTRGKAPQGEGDIRFTLIALVLVLAGTGSTAQTAVEVAPAELEPTASGKAWAAERREERRTATRCLDARRGLLYYRLRWQSWHELRGTNVKASGRPIPKACPYTKYLASVWKKRAEKARKLYLYWRRSYSILKDFRVCHGCNAWQRAIAEVQRAYPGTSSWLYSCSSTEGGHGRWVSNTQGSGAGGWMQFMESTFWRMYGAARHDVTSRGFRVPASANSWYSPLGQALAGAWGVRNGRSHEWYGAGC